MTLALYARRKQWPLEGVTIQLQHSRIYAADCAECETKEGMLWTADFRLIVQSAGVRIVLTPIRVPNANAYAERFLRSIRGECLDRLILFGERRLVRALAEFVAHYHGERNHQGLGNGLIDPAAAVAGATRVHCRDRLRGLLRYYHRAA
jgi:transposase InsO family protein